MSIKTFLKSTITSAKNNMPTLLAIGGVIAAGVTVYEAVKTAPKAKLKIEDARIAKEEAIRNELPDEKKNAEIKCSLSVAEKVAIVFKCTWPAIVAAVVSLGCTTGSIIASGRKIKAAQTAADLSEKALTEYMAASVKKLGAKKAEDIENLKNEEAVRKHPPKKNPDGSLMVTGKGPNLVYDSVMDVYFWSSIAELNRIANEIDARVLAGEFVTINEFYDDIGNGVKHPRGGSDLGFGAAPDEFPRNAFMHQTFCGGLSEDDEPIIVLSYTCRDRRYKEYIRDNKED